MKYFYFYNRHNKSDTLISALIAHDWHLTSPKQAKVIFTDVDVSTMRNHLIGYHRKGQKIFMVPHGAIPYLFNDYPGFEPFPHIAVNFVIASGHVGVMNILHYPHPLEVIGWYLCPLKQFQSKTSIKNILFAPIHPQGNNELSAENKQINIDTFQRLLKLRACDPEIKITVRYLYGLEANGLHPVEGVEFVQGKPDQAYQQIDEADIVVSRQTFAYLAIARGVPTVMMGEHIAPSFWYRGKFEHVHTWESYRHLMQFPFDILSEDDTMKLFQRVVASDFEIVDWKARMIGAAFDEAEFVRKVESYL